MPSIQLQLLLARLGWLSVLALGSLLLAAALHFAVMPRLQALTLVSQQSMSSLGVSHGTVDAGDQVVTQYAEFRKVLASPDERADLLKSLFRLASDAGVALTQADYQLQPDTACSCQRLQLTLPVRGTYPQVRAFVDNAQVKILPLSLDEISFRRENAKNSMIEARLRLTLYFREAD